MNTSQSLWLITRRQGPVACASITAATLGLQVIADAPTWTASLQYLSERVGYDTNIVVLAPLAAVAAGSFIVRGRKAPDALDSLAPHGSFRLSLIRVTLNAVGGALGFAVVYAACALACFLSTESPGSRWGVGTVLGALSAVIIAAVIGSLIGHMVRGLWSPLLAAVVVAALYLVRLADTSRTIIAWPSWRVVANHEMYLWFGFSQILVFCGAAVLVAAFLHTLRRMRLPRKMFTKRQLVALGSCGAVALLAGVASGSAFPLPADHEVLHMGPQLPSSIEARVCSTQGAVTACLWDHRTAHEAEDAAYAVNLTHHVLGSWPYTHQAPTLTVTESGLMLDGSNPAIADKMNGQGALAYDEGGSRRTLDFAGLAANWTHAPTVCGTRELTVPPLNASLHGAPWLATLMDTAGTQRWDAARFTTELARVKLC